MATTTNNTGKSIYNPPSLRKADYRFLVSVLYGHQDGSYVAETEDAAATVYDHAICADVAGPTGHAPNDFAASDYQGETVLVGSPDLVYNGGGLPSMSTLSSTVEGLDAN